MNSILPKEAVFAITKLFQGWTQIGALIDSHEELRNQLNSLRSEINNFPNLSALRQSVVDLTDDLMKADKEIRLEQRKVSHMISLAQKASVFCPQYYEKICSVVAADLVTDEKCQQCWKDHLSRIIVEIG